jgi:xanthine dehydrogenase accessory factor
MIAADAVRAAMARGCPAVEVTSLTDRPHRLVVVADGTSVGTLGSEALDREITGRASALIESRNARVITVPSVGGSAELFVQVHAPQPAIVVVGATDVAVTLVQLAKPLGFSTTVIDSRDRFANRERFPAVDALLVGMPSDLVTTAPLTRSSSLVLLSHDFKFDLPVLEIALRSQVGYIGVLGSRRRASAVREFLGSIGASADDVARVHIPVGLDIGARTPAEIALSVLAELVAVRSGGRAERGA